MTKLTVPFSKAETEQTTADVCEFGEILERFHEEFHISDQNITEEEDAKCRDLFEHLVINYVPLLTPAQWIKVLGELIVGMYIDDVTAEAA